MVRVWTVLLIGLLTGGGCNLFSEVSDKKTDNAILDDVRNYIDAGMWNDAILKWASLSAAGQAARSSKLLLATAYAGRGGLDIITLITSMNDNATSMSQSMFKFLMRTFRGSLQADYNDQLLAQNTITDYALDATDRTVDENIFMVFVEFAKIGTYLAYKADADGDGEVDPTFNNCTNISEGDSAQLLAAIGIVLQSLTAAGSSIADTSLAPLQTACSGTLGSISSFCENSDPAAILALPSVTRQLLISSINTLVGEGDLNVGLSAPATVATYGFVLPKVPCP